MADIYPIKYKTKKNNKPNDDWAYWILAGLLALTIIFFILLFKL